MVKEKDVPNKKQRVEFELANVQELEPLMHGETNLMTLYASDGPSPFGRLLAAELFGSGTMCALISQRLGRKKNQVTSRVDCDASKEELFKS